MSNSSNVTYGKAAIQGAVSVANKGTALPKNATEKLNEAFINLGYITEDGLTNSNTPESEKIPAWGGDIVLVTQTGKEDTFTLSLMEVLNNEVLKVVYGDENVSGDIETGIVVKANAKPYSARGYVIDQIMRDGALKRIVIPNGVISEVGEITYTDNEATSYEITVDALPDENGNTHYEYIQLKKSTDELGE